MADRKPLVISGGQIEQLQNGDVVCVFDTLIFGGENIEGSWKIVIIEGDLVQSKREGGEWVEKFRTTA